MDCCNIKVSRQLPTRRNITIGLVCLQRIHISNQRHIPIFNTEV